MIQYEKVIVFDVDGTICWIPPDCLDYRKAIPFKKIIERIQQLHVEGNYIILTTSRNMRTFDGNIGKINAITAPTLFNWLEENQVPYDEIHFGKPWCGKDGFYVDDRSVRPLEFMSHSLDQIREKLASENVEWKKKN